MLLAVSLDYIQCLSSTLLHFVSIESNLLPADPWSIHMNFWTQTGAADSPSNAVIIIHVGM